MAIDLAVLQYSQALFLRSPPNVTAWSETMEACLSVRSHELAGRVSLLLSYQNCADTFLPRTTCDDISGMLYDGILFL